MSDRLAEKLKEFEKELSLLLVAFMKIHDELAAGKGSGRREGRPPGRLATKPPGAPAPSMPPGAAASFEISAYA